MRRTGLAVVVSGIWLIGALAAVAVVACLGVGSLQLIDAAVPLLAAAGLTALLARRAERIASAELAALAKAAGVGEDFGDDRLTLTAVIGGLVGRMARMQPFRPAFLALERPALLIDGAGAVLAATAGCRGILGEKPELSLAALFGPEFTLPEPGGPAKLATVGGVRVNVHRQPLAGDLSLLELVPAGQVVADDDLDAFAEALASGRTSFRFDAAAAAKAPALAALNAALAEVDAIGTGMADLLEGRPVDAGFLAANAGLAPGFRQLHDAVLGLCAELDAEREARGLYEEKLQAIGWVIDGYRATAERVGELTGSARAEVELAGAALARLAAEAEAARQVEAASGGLAGRAVGVLDRTADVMGEMDRMATALESFVSTIEDISFRTNLLALNAAVEAARAGESGAGFAVVAEEVRTLARTSQQTTTDIRALVAGARDRSAGGVGEASQLKKILAELDTNLRNLSDAAEKIAADVEAGGRALVRATSDLDAAEGQAQRAMSLPRRAARAA